MNCPRSRPNSASDRSRHRSSSKTNASAFGKRKGKGKWTKAKSRPAQSEPWHLLDSDNELIAANGEAGVLDQDASGNEWRFADLNFEPLSQISPPHLAFTSMTQVFSLQITHHNF